MSEIAKGLKAKADKIFSEMSGKMMDAAENDNEMYPTASIERRKYYPRLTIPKPEEYGKQPGEMCHILALAEVKTVNEKTITVEIQKVIDLPASEEEQSEDDTEDEEDEDNG